MADPSCTHSGAASHDVGVRQCLGPAEEKKVRSPESLSYEAHAHCLLRGLELSTEASDGCWRELAEILQGCSRAPASPLAADFGARAQLRRQAQES